MSAEAADTSVGRRQNKERLLFIDGLRAIACLMVVFFHYYACSVLIRQPIAAVIPVWVDKLSECGAVGVQIFFVISGFVIAYAVSDARVNLEYIGRFIFRRSLRLDLPYWCAIAIAFLIRAHEKHRWFGVFWLDVRSLVDNIFYLQTIRNDPRILSVSWTLCYEVQFYLAFIFLIAILQRTAAKISAGRHRVVVVGTFAFSCCALAVAGGYVHLWSGLFFDRWQFFYMGVLTCWVYQARISRWWLGGFIAICIAATIHRTSFLDLSTPIVVCAIILLAIGLGAERSWLSARPWQWFALISYSVYLVHELIGGDFWLRVLGIAHPTAGVAAMGLLGGLIMGVLVSAVFFVVVERQALWLSHRVRLKKPVRKSGRQPLRAKHVSGQSFSAAVEGLISIPAAEISG